MRVVFLSELEVVRLKGGPWRLLSALRAFVHDGPSSEEIIVPAGFESDFASVPRLPFAFLLAGDTAHKSAVLHDYLYAQRHNRARADGIFRAAMKAEGVPAWRRLAMFAAVRAFGGAAYGDRAQARTPEGPAL